jgi:excisionase family DNA binding protein
MPEAMHRLARTRRPSTPPGSDAASSPTPPPRLLTTADVATRLQVSVKTVRRLISVGSLATLRIGRSVRVTEEALAALTGARGI